MEICLIYGGIPLKFLRIFNEISQKFLWNAKDISLELYWNFFGITLKFLWNFSEIILQNFSEISLIFHWNFIGMPKKFQWNISGISLKFLRIIPLKFQCNSNENFQKGYHFHHLLQKNLFEFRFYTHFFMFFPHVYIAPGQGQTTLCGQNSDVNRKALSPCPFVAGLKKISLKSDFIHIFAYFYTCI